MIEDCFACLCCCFDMEPSRPQNSSRRLRKSAKEYRLNTKYQKQDFLKISDEQRKGTKVKAYACPICTYYYNRILACSECTNCVCYQCFQSYDQRNVDKNARMRCPFCKSIKSTFADYELDPHSYFDTTNNGFISQEERLKIDNELRPANNSMQLGVVPEQNQIVAEEAVSQP